MDKCTKAQFTKAAAALSAYISVLPLSKAEVDGLIELVGNQTKAAAEDGFRSGLLRALQLNKPTKTSAE